MLYLGICQKSSQVRLRCACFRICEFYIKKNPKLNLANYLGDYKNMIKRIYKIDVEEITISERKK